MAATNEQLEKRVADLEAFVATLKAAIGGGASRGGAASAASNGAAASDTELDGRYGDPIVRRNPNRWAGASYEGANYSACPSEYLIVLAEFLEWKADQDSAKPSPKKHANGTPYFEYDRKDARLARGWARRNNGSAKPPPSTKDGDDDVSEPPDNFASSDSTPEDEIPF